MSGEISATIKLHRIRQWADEELRRLEAFRLDFAQVGAARAEALIDGRIHQLQVLIALWLLTPEESAESWRMRQEMFGTDD